MLAYIYRPRPLERGFAIWIFVIFHLIGGSFLCVSTLCIYFYGDTWTSVIMIGVVGEFISNNKNPAISNGA